jgi:small subunit ribosomal protein S14
VAKMALIERELKRDKLVAKYAKKYAELKAISKDAKRTEEERAAARLVCKCLPRNANPTRQRNRCEITGRPRGTLRTSAWLAPRFVKWPLPVRFQALSRLAGKRQETRYEYE